jgi:cyclophilin family peptidyl-prolyl cis-trans isomerase
MLMAMPTSSLLPVFLGLVFLFSEPSARSVRAQEPAEAPAATLDFSPGGPIPDSALGDYHVELDCAIETGPKGKLTLELWPTKAPVTVRNFLRYCAEGLYDGCTFHRVIREFMVQGGDPLGNGTGKGKYGMIPDEFSTDPDRSHGYGVISMAHSPQKNSASCQFFICTADSVSVFQLDGKYASFGKLVAGASMLEAIANVPSASDPSGKISRPNNKITIVKASVVKGPSPTGETIERPQPDFGDEPAKVVVQQVLVSFAEAARPRSTRTLDEAEALAKQLLERARTGEDFTGLVRSSSDETLQPLAEPPGTYKLLNKGAFDVPSERARLQLANERSGRDHALEKRFQHGEIDGAALASEKELLRQEFEARVAATCYQPLASVMPAFGKAAFALEPGEVVLLPFDPARTPDGWHVIKRIE